MKIYIIFKQKVGIDYYDLDDAEVYLSKEDAEKRDAELQIGDESIDIESTTIHEYNVEGEK